MNLEFQAIANVFFSLLTREMGSASLCFQQVEVVYLCGSTPDHFIISIAYSVALATR